MLSLCALSLSRIETASFALTPRERDVLDYLRGGFTNREIALACGSSTNTVKKQVRAIFDKLGATTRAEAVAISVRTP
ncbi:hypothetical protein BH09MYX1_BH09MYX1_27600 [soil metagenome]